MTNLEIDLKLSRFVFSMWSNVRYCLWMKIDWKRFINAKSIKLSWLIVKHCMLARERKISSNQFVNLTWSKHNSTKRFPLKRLLYSIMNAKNVNAAVQCEKLNGEAPQQCLEKWFPEIRFCRRLVVKWVFWKFGIAPPSPLVDKYTNTKTFNQKEKASKRERERQRS